MQEEKRRSIDWLQFFVYLWENKWKIIIVCAVCACCMVMFGKKKIQSTSVNSGASLSTIMNQNHDAYYKIVDKQIFSDAQAPAGTYNSAARVYINLNFEDIDGNDIIDYTQLSKAMDADMWLLIRNHEALQDIIDKLDLRSYADMKEITPDELMWLINSNFQGTRILNIVVTDVDPQRAHAIADEVVRHFVENAKEYLSIDDISVLDEASIPKERAAVSVSMSRREMMKYALAGVLSGGIIIVFILLLLYIIIPTLRTQRDLSHLRLNTFGEINKKRKSIDYQKIAYRLNTIQDVTHLIIADIDGKYDVDQMTEDIRKNLGEIDSPIELTAVNNFNNTPNSILHLNNHDSILFVGTYGKTKLKDVEQADALIKDTSIRDIGVVIAH